MANERQPKKLPWLERVKAKATYNFERRQRQAEEDRAFKEKLENGFAFDDAEEEEAPVAATTPAPGQGVSYTPGSSADDKKDEEE